MLKLSFPSSLLLKILNLWNQPMLHKWQYLFSAGCGFWAVLLCERLTVILLFLQIVDLPKKSIEIFLFCWAPTAVICALDSAGLYSQQQSAIRGTDRNSAEPVSA